MNDKELIQRVRVLKAMGFIRNYYELGMTEKGLYNWLGGYYKLGYKNKCKLNTILIERGL